jgi:ABC-2 type transport system ATP-binding protein
MIETVDLTRRFGEITAVDSLNLRIEDGRVFGFLGPNGAGKTTTVRMLCCLIDATSGTAHINGMDTRDEASRVRIRGMIGLLPETPGLYESLSAYRNLEFYAKLYDVPSGKREQRIKELLKTLGVWDRRDDAVGKFSKGMRQKIAIAMALVHDPELLFLDEPTSGLDPQAALTVRNYLLDLKREGRTIFINTHNLADAEKLCDTIGVLKRRLLDMGSPDELASKFYGRTSVFHLVKVSDPMVEGISSMPFVHEVRVVGDRILVDLDDPVASNPLIVRGLISMGAEVEFVNELKHGLEDVYLKLIEGS